MLILALFACDRQDPVTWQRDIRPLTAASCDSCHVAGGVAPFVFDEATVEALGPAMVDAVVERRMPPWGADPSCREILDSAWLSDDDVAAFVAWEAGGFELGDEAEYVAPELDEEPFDPGEPDLELGIPTPYAPDDSLADDYRCIPMEHAFTDDAYLSGIIVEPDRLDLVHHVIVYSIPEGDQATIVELDEADEGVGYSCFGDAGLPNAAAIGGWVPGTRDEHLGEDVGIRVPAGNQLVLQMHYNFDAVTEVESDQTRLQLWFHDSPPEWLLSTFPLFQDALEIEPGDAESVQSVRTRVPADALIVGTAPHMHTLGRALETTLTRPEGSTECLTRVPAYDFDWQLSYSFAEPVELSPEDSVTLTCTYDNRDGDELVTWGDGTNDEMCLDYLALLVPNLAGDDPGVCAGFPECESWCEPGDDLCTLSCMTMAGESCLYCGLDGLFGSCTNQVCQDELWPYYSCIDRCMDGEGDFFRCSFEDCRTDFDDWFACAWDNAEVCAEDYASCEGMF